MANQVAILAMMSLVAGLAKDTVKAVSDGKDLGGKVAEFEDLFPKFMEALSNGPDLLPEIKSLQASDYPSLAGVLISDLEFSSPHAQAIVQPLLKFLSDIASSVVPDSLALLQAIHSPPAA